MSFNLIMFWLTFCSMTFNLNSIEAFRTMNSINFNSSHPLSLPNIMLFLLFSNSRTHFDVNVLIILNSVLLSQYIPKRRSGRGTNNTLTWLKSEIITFSIFKNTNLRIPHTRQRVYGQLYFLNVLFVIKNYIATKF